MQSLASLLKWLGNGKRTSSAAAPPSAIDPLEPRALLAATLSTEGVVLVAGTDAPDAFVVRLNAARTDVQVQGGGGIALFRLSAVQSIQIEGGGGDDSLTVDTSAGLVGIAGAAVSIRFDGGGGADAVVITGAPAGVGVAETITPGPGAGEGKVISQDGQKSQTVQFVGVESLLDTSAAASLTVKLNDGSNLVEVAGGPVTDGVTTGTIRAFDVTPSDTPLMTTLAATGTVTAAAAAPAMAASATAAPATGAGADSAAAIAPVTAGGRRGKHKAKGHAKKPHVKKPHGPAAKAAAAQARAAAAASTATGSTATSAAPPASAAVAAVPQKALVIGVAHVPIQFANKTKITIDTGAGDDWIAVDAAAPAAGLASMTLIAGDGQDRVAEVALPAGVAWTKQGAESVSAVRDFVGVTEAPAAPTPAPTPEPVPDPTPAPQPPPTPVPAHGGGGEDDNGGKGDGDDEGDGDGNDDKGEKDKNPKKEKKNKSKEHKKGSNGDDQKGGDKGHGDDGKDKHDKKGKGKKHHR